MALERVERIRVPGNEIRMVLIGKTGVGKSKTGNAILGDTTKFRFGSDSNSVTRVCSWGSANRFGMKLDVVDTPGVFDTYKRNIDVQIEIARCIVMTAPGPQAILFCVKMGRFTEEDLDTIKHFLKYFGPELLRFVVVVFTQVDQWEADQRELKREPPNTEEYLQNLPEPLGNFLNRCGGRHVFVNNRLQGEGQVATARRIVSKVELMIRANDNQCYTNANYKKVEKALEDETRKSNQNRDDVKTSAEFLKVAIKLIELIITAVGLF